MAARKPNTNFEHVPLEIAIMKRQPNGKAYWVEAAKDVKSATKRVHALAEQFPGEYIIVNNKTGEELTIRTSDQDPTAGPPGPDVN